MDNETATLGYISKNLRPDFVLLWFNSSAATVLMDSFMLIYPYE